ncbi:hypothetical protein VAL12_006979 [Pseudomonas aeruginosa]|nr:hypothetical protein [Pseudomonas aeruginosa]EMB9912500.1 hypothetical protein [Pseudomonas aeruginosa]
MIRITCPFCFVTHGADAIEAGMYGGRLSILCPECNHVIVQLEDGDDMSAVAQLEDCAAL